MAKADVARVRPDEIPSIASIERRCFTDPWSEAAFREALANPRVFFAAVHEGTAGKSAAEDDGGGVVGYVVAWFILDEGEIANLAVAPDRRGQGFGARLLDAALAAAEQAGVATMFLEVRSSNQRARALYQSRGFVEIGRRSRYYRRPVEDAVLLRRAAGAAQADARHDL